MIRERDFSSRKGRERRYYALKWRFEALSLDIVVSPERLFSFPFRNWKFFFYLLTKMKHSFLDFQNSGCLYTTPSFQREDDSQMFYPVYQTTSVPGNGSQIQNSVSSLGLRYPLTEAVPYEHLTGLIGSDDVNFLSSKYLKPTQQLLNEAVHIGTQINHNKLKRTCGIGFKGSVDISGISETCKSSELSPSEQQDLQNKKTKLLSLLEETDKKYSQYYQQTQFLITSFETVAGFGASRPYISVALQRISGQFRCLRDTIKTQIKVVKLKQGEQETASLEEEGERIPRLRYVEQHMRQNRAFRQRLCGLGPVWRAPQRGLPETSVSVLRAWLFEHFLHPYPKDSEKILLAREAGLSRNQVANWFINARVRLWKPMIEEMYREELGGPETRPETSGDNEHGEQVLQESNRAMASETWWTVIRQ